MPSPLKSAIAAERERKPGTEDASGDPNEIEDVASVSEKKARFDVPPPGVGLNTLTQAVLGVATLEAGTVAVS
jgi:hypothetical protein